MVKRKRIKKRMGTCDSCGKHRKTRSYEGKLHGGNNVTKH